LTLKHFNVTCYIINRMYGFP